MPSSSNNYGAQFEGPIQGYVVNFLKKNYWRVQRSTPREDVMQEAYVVFLRVKRKYPEMDTPQHFMALFKRAWANHFTDMTNADTADRIFVQNPSHQYDEGEPVEFEHVGDLNHDGELSVMLRQAPSEVSAVLNLFLSAPQELFELAMGSWKRDARQHTNGSKHICHLLGLDPKLDVMQMTADYFRPPSP